MPNASDEYYSLGYISRTHGIKGQVVLRLDVDDPDRYQSIEQVFLKDDRSDIEEYKITGAEIRQDTALVFFAGVNDVDAAKGLVGKTVLLPMQSLPELDERSVYFHEAIGMNVNDKQLGELGPVKKVYDLPVQPLVAVNVDGKEMLFPLLRQFIVKVDREQRVIFVDLPEGLADVYK